MRAFITYIGYDKQIQRKEYWFKMLHRIGETLNLNEICKSNIPNTAITNIIWGEDSEGTYVNIHTI